MLAHARNAAVVLAIAAIVAFVPQGDETASFAGNLIGIAITAIFLFFGMRLYQAMRTDIYGLGDRWRAVLYGTIGVFVLAMAARPRLVDSDAGTAAFIAALGLCAYGLYACWRRYRAHII